MITDEKIKKVWDVVIEINKNFIQTRKSFTPVCFIIKKNYSLGTIMMIFNGSNAKEVMKQKLKKLIVSQRLRGYILCMDTKLTKMNLEKNEVESVSDALVHNLFTPKESVVHVIEYDKDYKITNEYEEQGKLVSDWNVWDYEGRNEQQKKVEKDYFDFKEKHPDRYGGTF